MFCEAPATTAAPKAAASSYEFAGAGAVRETRTVTAPPAGGKLPSRGRCVTGRCCLCVLVAMMDCTGEELLHKIFIKSFTIRVFSQKNPRRMSKALA